MTVIDPPITWGDPPPPPPPRYKHPAPLNEAETWWEQYRESLLKSGWSDASIAELESSAEKILDGVDVNIDGRFSRTAVVGEVQSGKTASMIGLVAKGLDVGFKIIVVLAGDKNDLRRQTCSRFNKDLLWVTEKINDGAWSLQDTPSATSGRSEGPVAGQIYTWAYLGTKRATFLPFHCEPNQCKSLIAKQLETVARDKGGTPAILVVKKTPHDMRALQDTLCRVLGHEEGSGPEDFPIMVLDDESDYATMPRPHQLDQNAAWKPMARLNWNLIIGFEEGQTMEHHPAIGIHGNFNLYAFDYTATPQLPHSHVSEHFINNKLWPNPFASNRVIVLKSASDVDTETQYDTGGDRYGKFSWYTGPEMFYGQLANERPPGEGISHPTPETLPGIQPNMDPTGAVFPLREYELDPDFSKPRFENPLMAHLVSGAVRFAQQDASRGGSVGNMKLSLDPKSSDPWPETHTMLIHVELKKDEHWKQAQEVLNLFGDLRGSLSTDEPVLWVARSQAIDWIEEREEPLKKWYDYFHSKYLEITEDEAVRDPYPNWEYVNEALQHWARHIKIKVVNSSNKGETLDFESRANSKGGAVRPTDVYTIVIGGNKLSRGLTIDGLSTTVFGRIASQPNQSTMMQHQRWCGYRAGFWEFVTLHIQEEARDLMEIWSAADQIDRMAHAKGTIRPLRFTTMGNRHAIKGNYKMPRPVHINPLGDYQFRHVELKEPGANEEIMATFIDRVLKNPISHPTGPSIVNITDTMTSLEVADLLDSLEYTATGTNWIRTIANGGRSEAICFQSIEDWFESYSKGQISGILKEDPASVGSVLPISRNPSLIAAYLRVWHYLYHDHAELTKYAQDHGLMVRPQPPPVFNLVFQGGDSSGSEEGMHKIFTDERLTNLAPSPLRRAAHNDRGINQMRTGNSPTNPGGNRYIDLKVLRGPENPHPEDRNIGLFRGYRYNRTPDEPGVIIGQAFDKGHLGDYCHKNHIPVSFMIDIPEGGPSFRVI